MLADSHPLWTEGLRRVLAAQVDLTVVGACLPAEVVEVADRVGADVVILGTSGRGCAGEAIPAVGAATAVLVLSEWPGGPCEPGGASGHLVKDASAGDVVHAVRTILAGGLVHGACTPVRPPPGSCLTARETHVLQLLATGLSNPAIGAALGISATTAKFHVANIFGKLHAGGRAEAVMISTRSGLL